MKSQKWAAYNSFLERPWWTRVWVIQEVAVSDKVVVLCGEHSIGWDHLMFNLLEFYHVLRSLGMDAPVRRTSRLRDAIELGAFRVRRLRTSLESQKDTEMLELLLNIPVP